MKLTNNDRIWVREFKCDVCGKIHEVTGRRSQLNKLQGALMADCKNGKAEAIREDWLTPITKQPTKRR